MTNEQAKKVLGEFREDAGRWLDTAFLRERPFQVSAREVARVAHALDLLLRSDSDVRREERERCAKVVEHMRHWTFNSKNNIYGCAPCPKCNSKYRAPYKKPDGRLRIECDDCRHDEWAVLKGVGWPIEEGEDS